MPEHAPKKAGHEASASEEMIQAIEWVTRNRNSIFLVVAALLVGGSLFGYMRYLERKVNEEAWQAFYTAEVRNRRSENPVVEAKALREAADATRSPAAFYALMRQIAVQGSTYDADDMRAAVEAGEAFLARFPRHTFAPQVRLDTGTLLLNLGRYAEARTQFETVLKSEATYLHEDAEFYLAQTHAREDNTAEASRIYSRMSRWDDATVSPQTRDLAVFANLLLQEGTTIRQPVSETRLEDPFPIRVPTLEDLGRLAMPEDGTDTVGDADVPDADLVPADAADIVPAETTEEDTAADTDPEGAPDAEESED